MRETKHLRKQRSKPQVSVVFPLLSISILASYIRAQPTSHPGIPSCREFRYDKHQLRAFPIDHNLCNLVIGVMRRIVFWIFILVGMRLVVLQIFIT